MAKKLDPHEALKRQWMTPAQRRREERFDKVPDFIWKIFGWMLIALVYRLRQAARLLGIPTETRPFTPHLTLTRQMPADQSQEILASLPAFEPIRLKVTAVTLMQSIPENGHMRYEPIKRSALIG